MPNWTDRPPVHTRQHAYSLFRTPAQGTISGIITSPTVLGCLTHFYRGRTIPCEGENCPACNDKRPPRYHAYVGLLGKKSREHALFELTGHAAAPLYDWIEAGKSLRGAALNAYRTRGGSNAPVTVQLSQMPGLEVVLPEPPDIQAALELIWGEARSLATNGDSHNAERA